MFSSTDGFDQTVRDYLEYYYINRGLNNNLKLMNYDKRNEEPRNIAAHVIIGINRTIEHIDSLMKIVISELAIDTTDVELDEYYCKDVAIQYLGKIL